MTVWPKGGAKPAIWALNAADYLELKPTLQDLFGMGPKALAAIETALKERRNSSE